MKLLIKEIRKSAGVSQEALAKLSGVSRATISNIENDKKTVTTTRTLEKIATALGKRVEQLIELN